MEREPHVHETSGWQVALIVALVTLIALLLIAFFLPLFRTSSQGTTSPGAPTAPFRQQQIETQPDTQQPGIQGVPTPQSPGVFQQQQGTIPGRNEQEQQNSGSPTGTRQQTP